MISSSNVRESSGCIGSPLQVSIQVYSPNGTCGMFQKLGVWPMWAIEYISNRCVISVTGGLGGKQCLTTPEVHSGDTAKAELPQVSRATITGMGH